MNNENPDKDTRYQCKVCLVWHPVMILARDCEEKH